METETAEATMTGVVKFFGLDFGFIQPDDSGLDDVYIHYSNIEPWRRGHKRLAIGQSVKFELTTNDKGYEAKDLEIHPDDRGMSRYEEEEILEDERCQDQMGKIPGLTSEKKARLPSSKFQTGTLI